MPIKKPLMKNCKNNAHDILGNDDEICQLCAETETETQTKQEWEKRFDALYYGSTCGGDGLFNFDLYLDIKQFIAHELQIAFERGREAEKINTGKNQLRTQLRQKLSLLEGGTK